MIVKVRVKVHLESIPTDFGQKAEYTLGRSPEPTQNLFAVR